MEGSVYSVAPLLGPGRGGRRRPGLGARVRVQVQGAQPGQQQVKGQEGQGLHDKAYPRPYLPTYHREHEHGQHDRHGHGQPDYAGRAAWAG